MGSGASSPTGARPQRSARQRDFDRSDVAHLLRRVGFGARTDELDTLLELRAWDDVVESVLDVGASPPDTIPPEVDDLVDEFHAPWVAAQNYWLDRMATTPTPIMEKLTLFWHGHFTSARSKVKVRRCFRQVATLRSLALGDFEELAQAAAVDPAMLEWLDNSLNTAFSPNENFARELMELFTLGLGAFTEPDVIGMARAWSGHGLEVFDGVDRYEYRFHQEVHDAGPKEIFGITRNWDGPETITEIVRGVKQEACATFIAAKLWTFLVADDPPAAVVAELARAFVRADMQVLALVRAILRHPQFRAPANRWGLVRGPAEWTAAVLRSTGLRAASVTPDGWLRFTGQELYNPPDVSGWGTNAYWLSTSSAWGRGAFAYNARFAAADHGVLSGVGDLSPAEAARSAFDQFDIHEPSAATRRDLEAYVASEQAAGRQDDIAAGLIALTILAPDFQVA